MVIVLGEVIIFRREFQFVTALKHDEAQPFIITMFIKSVALHT